MLTEDTRLLGSEMKGWLYYSHQKSYCLHAHVGSLIFTPYRVWRWAQVNVCIHSRVALQDRDTNPREITSLLQPGSKPVLFCFLLGRRYLISWGAGCKWKSKERLWKEWSGPYILCKPSKMYKRSIKDYLLTQSFKKKGMGSISHDRRR